MATPVKPSDALSVREYNALYERVAQSRQARKIAWEIEAEAARQAIFASRKNEVLEHELAQAYRARLRP